MCGDFLVSVITPCFNSSSTIECTIQSVISQKDVHLEYIIVDGGSTDGTLDILKRYTLMYPDIIRYVSEPDKGIYDAMNKGIRMAHGHIVGIVNSDDYYEPEALKTVLSYYNGEKYAILYGAVRLWKDHQYYFTIHRSHTFLPECMILHPACFVTRDVYQDIGLYSLDYKSASDYDFMLKLYYLGKVSFIPIPHILSNFTVGGISSTYRGSMETLLVKNRYHLVDNATYRREMFKFFKLRVKSYVHRILKKYFI